MRELVDKQLMLEDVKSWVAMDSYEQHLINNMSAWIENLPTVGVSDGDCISRRVVIETISRMMPKSYTLDGSHPADEEIFMAQEIYADCIKAIEILSSVQPEIIRCEDCIHYNKHEDCIKYQRDGFCSEWVRNTYKDWYCSRAERSVKYE